MRQKVVGVSLAISACIAGRIRADSQNFTRKIARISTAFEICAISVPDVRARRKKSAHIHSKHVCRDFMNSCAFREALAGAGRVLRTKNAPRFIETSAISTENHGF